MGFDYGYWYNYGTSDGNYSSSATMGGRSYCTKMSHVGDSYVAICDIDDGKSLTGTCPKGWGRNKERYPRDYYSALNGQGFIADTSNPIYTTVTKYRDTVYNYTAGRIAKA